MLVAAYQFTSFLSHIILFQRWHISSFVYVSNTGLAKRHGSDDAEPRDDAEHDVIAICSEYDEPDGGKP